MQTSYHLTVFLFPLIFFFHVVNGSDLKYIYRNGIEEWCSFDSSPYCSTSSFDGASSILQEAYSFLQSLNISVEQVRHLFLISRLDRLL